MKNRNSISIPEKINKKSHLIKQVALVILVYL